ncbi:hypothetical protein SEA_LIBERTYBELL_56 [Streptomyces phage LibertyBell]|nr:hypothetical protein SEA_LIBERTYBELL_56 [Streptomyces phage LibertyBell]
MKASLGYLLASVVGALIGYTLGLDAVAAYLIGMIMSAVAVRMVNG